MQANTDSFLACGHARGPDGFDQESAFLQSVRRYKRCIVAGDEQGLDPRLAFQPAMGRAGDQLPETLQLVQLEILMLLLLHPDQLVYTFLSTQVSDLCHEISLENQRFYFYSCLE